MSEPKRDKGFLCARLTESERVALSVALAGLREKLGPNDKPSWEAYWADEFLRVLASKPPDAEPS